MADIQCLPYLPLGLPQRLFLLKRRAPRQVYLDEREHFTRFPTSLLPTVLVLYEAQTYASIQTPGQTSAPEVDAKTIDDLKRSPQYLVATPDDVVAKVSTASAMAALVFNPLCGGMPPELGWASLELFAAKVLPRLDVPAL